MNLHEAKAMYESGASLKTVAEVMGTYASTVARGLRGVGVTIRPQGAPVDEPYVHAPSARLCTYGCGRPTTLGSHACGPCSVNPPCTCSKRAIRSGSFFFGKEKCLRCGLLIEGKR